MKTSAVLIGYMGAGKSTVARALATKSGAKLLDTDELLTERFGMSISRFFELQGEEAFRERETALLKELSEQGFSGILSTGGGMPLREANRALLKKLGHVFYLKATPQVIAGRLWGHKGRPLLEGVKDKEELTERIGSMLKVREEAYLAAADTVLDTDDNDLARVLEQISHIVSLAEFS
ncbi:MAG: shikimate kinase [Lachnospiraceae bacterium]|nr:shikimate kinase [Lachnospiraceae bacterium]